MALAIATVLIPDMTSVLVAPPRREQRAGQVADDVATAAAERGLIVRRVSVRERGRGEEEALPPDRFATLISARSAIHSPDHFSVVAGVGILDDPYTFMAAAASDAVLVVVRRGRSTRNDLQRVRIEIERAGGKIAGAILTS